MRIIGTLLLAFFMCTDIAARLPDLIPYRKGNLWGYCDSSKNIIIQAQWAAAFPFSGNTAAVDNGSKFAIIDSTGNLIAPFKYKQMIVKSAAGKRIVYSGNGKKAGVIDEHGKLIIPMNYNYLQWCGDKYLAAGRRNRSGVIDTAGNVVIPFIYKQDAFTWTWSDSVNTYFSFRNKAGYGIVNDSGRVVVPFQYHHIEMKYGAIQACFNSEICHFFNKKGEVVGVQTHFSWIQTFILENWATPRDTSGPEHETRMGWVGAEGQWLNTTFYRYAGEFKYGRACVQTDDYLFGFVNEKFEMVIKSKYYRALTFDDGGLAQVFVKDSNKQDGAFVGYIDIYGTEYWED